MLPGLASFYKDSDSCVLAIGEFLVVKYLFAANDELSLDPLWIGVKREWVVWKGSDWEIACKGGNFYFGGSPGEAIAYKNLRVSISYSELSKNVVKR